MESQPILAQKDCPVLGSYAQAVRTGLTGDFKSLIPHTGQFNTESCLEQALDAGWLERCSGPRATPFKQH